MIGDRDGTFTAASDHVLSGNSTRVINTPARSPPANSYAGRFAGMIGGQCPGYVPIPGERHLRTVPAGYARHYHGHRPHQGLQQQPPQRQPGHAVDITARTARRQVLDGLISEHRRAAQRARNARSAATYEFWHGTRWFEPSCAHQAKQPGHEA